MPRTQLAQIGLGGYGRAITEGALASDNAHIHSVFDVDTKLCSEVAKKIGAKAEGSFKEILADDEIKGVVLILPNHIHQPMAEEAFAAGKHVYVEKPIANTMSEGRAMVAAAEAASRILMVGHNTRRQGPYRKVKQIVDDGDLGQIVAVDAQFSHRGGISCPPDAWRQEYEKCPAVPLMQLGVHAIDTLLYLFGPVTVVSSFQRASGLMSGDNHDVTVTLLEFESGILGTLNSHYVIPGRNYINLLAVDANLFSTTESLELQHQDYSVEEIDTPTVNTQAEELDDFATSIETGEAPETDGAVGLEALAVIEAAIVSAKQDGRPVEVSSV